MLFKLAFVVCFFFVVCYIFCRYQFSLDYKIHKYFVFFCVQLKYVHFLRFLFLVPQFLHLVIFKKMSPLECLEYVFCVRKYVSFVCARTSIDGIDKRYQRTIQWGFGK